MRYRDEVYKIAKDVLKVQNLPPPPRRAHVTHQLLWDELNTALPA
jgi:hypothetical protein